MKATTPSWRMLLRTNASIGTSFGPDGCVRPGVSPHERDLTHPCEGIFARSMNLTATDEPSRVRSARTTNPNPPEPSSSQSEYVDAKSGCSAWNWSARAEIVAGRGGGEGEAGSSTPAAGYRSCRGVSGGVGGMALPSVPGE